MFLISVGEVGYHSRVTEVEEFLPVSLSLCSRPGNVSALTSTFHRGEERRLSNLRTLGDSNNRLGYDPF